MVEALRKLHLIDIGPFGTWFMNNTMRVTSLLSNNVDAVQIITILELYRGWTTKDTRIELTYHLPHWQQAAR